MEIALSIVSIVLSIPALFLGLYNLVHQKARDLASEIGEQDRHYSRDPIGARVLGAEHEMGPGMYDLDGSSDDTSDFLEDSDI